MYRHLNAKKWLYRFFSLFIVISCLYLFFEIAGYLQTDKLIIVDQLVMKSIPFFHSEGLTAIFSFLTSLASVTFTSAITVILCVCFFFFKKRKEGWILALSVAGGGLFNYVLKAVYERQRPDIDQLIEVSGFSFPSGHSMNAVTLYGMLAVLCFFMMNRLILKLMNGIGFCLLIFLIGVSRVYLGVHYVSDVIAGYLAGFAWLSAAILFYRSMSVRKK
ncbi:phosphatase PAP2 family protein [Alteribacillus sp. YIM 98480]|uniref:phosphatase PAP2 family protein n=1 Tax=Alteribacillus sp. YIM 98480 TaxID=2606599 RepID=UPI00131D300B|nr:phosphatase PAP2 family protein [Alteribacillus sp. YIM 98480]